MAIRALVTLMALARGAAGAPVALHWSAPSVCPDAADVDARVARRLAPAVVAGAPIDVTVRADTGGFVADIGGARTLTSASCAELADAVALIVARLVLEAREAPPPAPLVVVRASQAPRAVAPELGIAARISGTGGIGAQPVVGVGAELAVPMHWRSLLVEPAAAAWSRSTTESSPSAAGVAIALRTATLRVGWRPPQLPVRAWLAADLGELRGTGVRVAPATSGTATWAGVGAGAAVVWRLRPDIALVGTGELIAALDRPRFELADGELLFRPAATIARLAVGLEVGWP